MNGSTILLVDDDQEDLELLEEAFAQSGITDVTLVNTAAAAVQYLEEAATADQLPLVVITDLYLPGRNGVELMNEIYSNTSLSHIKVIILSSFKFEAVNQMYEAITHGNYFEKPNTFQKYLELAAGITTGLPGRRFLSANIA